MRIILNPIKDNTASRATESTSIKRLRVSLGTLVAVEAAGSCAAIAEVAIEAAFTAIAHVHRRMHPHSPDSDLAKINHAPPNTRLTVHPSVRLLLDFARRLNSLTDGAFDPCLPARPGRLQDIEVSTEHVLCRAPVALDFGGFAKGFAVDQAIEALLRNGCTGGLVNAGGDLRVFGPRTEPVFLRGPKGELKEARFADGALAVSDADSQHRPAEHQGYYVRNRRNDLSRGSGSASDRSGGSDGGCDGGLSAGGGPSGSGCGSDDGSGNDRCSVDTRMVYDPLVTRYAAVMAKEAMVADALSKCVLVCTPDTAARALRAFGATRVAT